jgi:hypothetical protein
MKGGAGWQLCCGHSGQSPALEQRQRVQEDSPSKERTACRKETQLETLGKAHYDRKKKNERQQETQGKHKELYKTVMDHI